METEKIKLLIHDLDQDTFREQFPGLEKDWVIISKEKRITQCIGCFGCWVKTPGTCVIRDDFQNLGNLVIRSREIVLISECVYSGFSPFIKNVLDRSVSCLLPFFTVRKRDRMMHHRARTENRPELRAFFYGEYMSATQKRTAERIVAANGINMNAASHSVCFLRSPAEIADIFVRGQSFPRRQGLKAAFINGSPKTGKNNSAFFAEELEKKLSGECTSVHIRIGKPEITRSQLEQLSDCDVMVFCFPLYVDAFPSHLLHVLRKMEAWFRDRPRDGHPPKVLTPKVYALINNGFYEGEQNMLVMEMLRYWCEQAGLEWVKGTGIGGGEMFGNLDFVPTGYGPKKSMGKLLDDLAADICGDSTGGNRFGGPDLPRPGFTFMGNRLWKGLAKGNGLRVRDMYKRPLL